MTYICTKCGNEHDDWPALAFSSPAAYHALSKRDKKKIAQLSDDFCVIRNPDQTDRFIRATLTLKVVDHCNGLDYGIWVSLSEKSYQDYSDNFNNPNHQVGYFGWLNSNIPDYHFSKPVPTNVLTRTGGQRPEIVLHDTFDHPLVRDYFDGITKTEAERRIAVMMAAINK
jgi:hypothetical protein